jgi:hypothetical protein
MPSWFGTLAAALGLGKKNSGLGKKAGTWARKLGEGIGTFGKKWLHRDLKFGHSSQPVLP